MSERLLLGLTGQPGSGKTKAAEYLAYKHNFTLFNGSDYLQAEAIKRGAVLRERSDYVAFQRRLREEISATFMTDLVLDMEGNRVSHVGLRNRLDAIKHIEHGGIIVALTCPAELRHERTIGNGPKYPESLEDFIAAELSEYNDPDPFGLQTQWVMDNSTYRIDTSEPIADSQLALDKIVATQITLLA